MVRAFAEDEEKKVRISAVVGIVGFLNVPFVVASIWWLRTQHPSPVIGGGDDSGLAPPMLLTLLFCVLTFTILYISLLRRRFRLESVRRRVDEIRHTLEEQTR
jgi:heme exporter protein C